MEVGQEIVFSDLIERGNKDPLELIRLKAEFRENGYILLNNLFTRELFDAITKDCEKVFSMCQHRNFTMPGYLTPRKLSVAGGKMISEESVLIPYIYVHYELIAFLSKIVGKDLYTINHKEECFVANYLKAEGETHGWHLDDPMYALIVVLESPGPDNGGCVEFIQDWRTLCRENNLDPHADVNAGVELAESLGRIRSFSLERGECYFLNASENLHRVTPITKKGCKRKVLNMAYDHRSKIEFGQTADILYAQEG